MQDKQDMISIEEARDIILSAVKPLPIERVGIVDALGRVAAENLTSDIDINPFDDSAMDGFAVIASDIADASESNPISLDIVFVLGAGNVYDKPLASGQAIRIMTGAAMPKGADTVVMIEQVSCSGDGGVGCQVTFTAPEKPGKNIRFAGEDVRAGEVVIHAGETIGNGGAGLLASTGNVTVPVYIRPKIGIISLGTELVDADVRPTMGMKRNSNAYALAAEVVQAGCTPLIYPIAPDEYDVIRATVEKAVAECDFVVSSGGASAGDFDYISQIVQELGDFKFAYVRMRPGKSQTFGIIDGVPFFGLAGNPAAAVIGFEMLVRPALRKMQGFSQLERSVTRARLTSKTKSGNRRLLLRGYVGKNDDGSYYAEPAKNQSSALFSTLHHSNCLIVIPEFSETADAGMEVDCLRTDMEEGTVV